MTLCLYRHFDRHKRPNLIEHQQHTSATTVTMSPRTQTPAVVRVGAAQASAPCPACYGGPWSYGGRFPTCDAGACGRKALHRYTRAAEIHTFVGQKIFWVVRGDIAHDGGSPDGLGIPLVRVRSGAALAAPVYGGSQTKAHRQVPGWTKVRRCRLSAPTAAFRLLAPSPAFAMSPRTSRQRARYGGRWW